MPFFKNTGVIGGVYHSHRNAGDKTDKHSKGMEDMANQNLGMAYSISRKNRKKMALGGKSSDKPNMMDTMSRLEPTYAEGGEVRKREGEPYPWKGPNSSSTGVNAPLPTRETAGWHGNSQSEAGTRLRTANKYGPDMASSKQVAMDDAKHLHKQTLSEMRSMKKPNLYAEGGNVDSDNGDFINQIISPRGQKGINRPRYIKQSSNLDHKSGESHMGKSVRQGDMSGAKKVAYDTLREGRNMKKPNLYAHGGMAEWDDAGDLGYPMLEDMLPEDIYSKEGIINYALGGDVPEPTSQHLGDEDYLDEMEMPIEHNDDGGMGMHEQAKELAMDDVSGAIRKKYMAKGGAVAEDEAADDNAIEHLNDADALNYDLGDDEMYSEMSALHDIDHASNANLGSKGMDKSASDQMDMIGAIRRKYMKAK